MTGIVDYPDGPESSEPSVLISARTEDGRKVKFSHDKIRDWYGDRS